MSATSTKAAADIKLGIQENTIVKKSANIEINWGRILLIDLGSLIKSEPLIGDTNSIRAYALSGLSEENDKSIIAIQGLKENGTTDLSLNTEAGFMQFSIELQSSQGLKPQTVLNSANETINPHNKRSCIQSKPIPVALERSLIVELDAPINEFVLASQPNTVELRHLVSESDPAYLRSFVLHTKAQGLTDIVVASKSGVYKFTLKIGGQNNEHTEYLHLDHSSCDS